MHFVYLLKSSKNNNLYIGCTNDLKKRISMHNSGESLHTNKYKPWQLIYFEAYVSKNDAFEREKSLKRHAQGLRRLKERLRNTLVVKVM